MSDICQLILDQHHEMRRRFAELDELSVNPTASPTDLAAAWGPLRELLDAHAEAEEMLFYPILLRARDHARDETVDAISDHNDIRDACRQTDNLVPGGDGWWAAVASARSSNSTHMAEEERGPLRDLRTAVEAAAREDAAERWEAFMTGRRSELAARSHDKNPDRYVSTHDGGDR